MTARGSSTTESLQDKTLAAATEDVCTINGVWTTMLVDNSGSGDLYCTLDGTAAVAGADGTFKVKAGTAKRFRRNAGDPVITTVRLISTPGTTYSIETIGVNF